MENGVTASAKAAIGNWNWRIVAIKCLNCLKTAKKNKYQLLTCEKWFREIDVHSEDLQFRTLFIDEN